MSGEKLGNNEEPNSGAKLWESFINDGVIKKENGKYTQEYKESDAHKREVKLEEEFDKLTRTIDDAGGDEREKEELKEAMLQEYDRKIRENRREYIETQRKIGAAALGACLRSIFLKKTGKSVDEFTVEAPTRDVTEGDKSGQTAPTTGEDPLLADYSGYREWKRIEAMLNRKAPAKDATEGDSSHAEKRPEPKQPEEKPKSESVVKTENSPSTEELEENIRRHNDQIDKEVAELIKKSLRISAEIERLDKEKGVEAAVKQRELTDERDGIMRKIQRLQSEKKDHGEQVPPKYPSSRTEKQPEPTQDKDGEIHSLFIDEDENNESFNFPRPGHECLEKDIQRIIRDNCGDIEEIGGQEGLNYLIGNVTSSEEKFVKWFNNISASEQNNFIKLYHKINDAIWDSRELLREYLPYPIERFMMLVNDYRYDSSHSNPDAGEIFKERIREEDKAEADYRYSLRPPRPKRGRDVVTDRLSSFTEAFLDDNDSFLKEIRESSDRIGGQKSIDYLTGRSTSSMEELKKWWDRLNESEQDNVIDLYYELREKVRDYLYTIDSHPFNKTAYSWYILSAGTPFYRRPPYL